jgi:hypothetical protein
MVKKAGLLATLGAAGAFALPASGATMLQFENAPETGDPIAEQGFIVTTTGTGAAQELVRVDFNGSGYGLAQTDKTDTVMITHSDPNVRFGLDDIDLSSIFPFTVPDFAVDTLITGISDEGTLTYHFREEDLTSLTDVNVDPGSAWDTGLSAIMLQTQQPSSLQPAFDNVNLINITTVPEPSSLGYGAVGSLLLLRRRRDGAEASNGRPEGISQEQWGKPMSEWSNTFES